MAHETVGSMKLLKAVIAWNSKLVSKPSVDKQFTLWVEIICYHAGNVYLIVLPG